MSDDSPEAAVRAVVRAFYVALGALDFPAMAAVWRQSAGDLAVHPGWDPMAGWDAVAASWRAIFAGTPLLHVDTTEVSLEVFGDVARHTCLERTFAVSEGLRAAGVSVATQLLVRGPAGWRVVLHHAGPVAGSADTDDGPGPTDH